MAFRVKSRKIYTAKPPPSPAGVGTRPVDILDNVQTVLKESKDLLSLAPVPGLSAAVGVLLAILDQVKKMRSNADMVQSISKQMKDLNSILARVARRVAERAAHLHMSAAERTEMWGDLQASDGWQERVEQLKKDLQELLGNAQACADGPWHKRLFRSNRDEETLKRIREDFARILQTYQLAGTLSIEALTEHSLGQLEATYIGVKRIAAEQGAQYEEKTIEAIPHADSAGYKSASNVDKSFYLSGTRKIVFERLEKWVSSEKPVCFLIGAAGMGKSTIASEFCRRHEAELGASFFFRRNDPNVGSTVVVISTIAYQLAQSRPELYPYIARTAGTHIKAGRSQQMRYAIDDLLHKPLRAAQAAGVLPSLYIVVDGLDECQESQSQLDLVPECLELLLGLALQYPSYLRLLVTSRPDPNHVERALQQSSRLREFSILLSLYHIEARRAIDRDIGELIQTRLCTTPDGAQWHQRDPTVVARLTEQSQGVFVYARSAVDFIVRSAGIAQMEHRLQLLLSPGNTYGLGNLDLLYRTVLETAFPPDDLDPQTHNQLRLVLAWIALCKASRGIDPEDLEKLSGIPRDESIPILTKLRAVLIFDSGARHFNREAFRAMHVTFRDFLVARERCGDNYHVDAVKLHARFATDCLNSMHNDLNGCDYALISWPRHVVAAVPTTDLVNLLEEIFRSIPTDRPSPFFNSCLFGGLTLDSPVHLLRWVNLHIGRDLAKVIGEQVRLEMPYATIDYGEEITLSRLPLRSPGSSARQEMEELKTRHESQKRHFYTCWAKNFPGDADWLSIELEKLGVDSHPSDGSVSNGQL